MEFTLFSGKELNWIRYWCPYPGRIHCGTSGAFLTDPEEKFFGSENSHLKKTDTLLPVLGPLVLCGEPGLGKSTELQGLSAKCTKEEGALLSIDFREIADFSSFSRTVFDSPQWVEWVAGENRFTLIIDGVDEGIMRIPPFVESLTRELRQVPVIRLRLILACRTAEWPNGRRRLKIHCLDYGKFPKMNRASSSFVHFAKRMQSLRQTHVPSIRGIFYLRSITLMSNLWLHVP